MAARRPIPHPGPLDGSLLTLQATHRSNAAWHGEASFPITVKRCDGMYWSEMSSGAVDQRIRDYITVAGFHGVTQAGSVGLDHHLITALIERWRQETHTFHLPYGEATITLQDVEILWGLRVDGLPVTIKDVRRSLSQKKQLVLELLGFVPDDDAFKDNRLKLIILEEHLLKRPLRDDASDVEIRQYARMYLLLLFGGCFFADGCNNVVNLNWLEYMRDLEGMAAYSWGSAVLATLYNRMCHGSIAGVRNTAGPYVLLQLWAWERLPTIRPRIVTPFTLGDHPLGRKWSTQRSIVDAPQHSLTFYRSQLQKLLSHEFLWEPYTTDVVNSLPAYCKLGYMIWRSNCPLICGHIVEMHLPYRVLRQFGLCQPIPHPPDTSEALHNLKLKGGSAGKDWGKFHKNWVDYWAMRHQSLDTDVTPLTTYHSNDEYIDWYHRVTVRYIAHPVPSQPSPEGYREDGGSWMYLNDRCSSIGLRAADYAARTDVPPESYQQRLAKFSSELVTTLLNVGQVYNKQNVPPLPLPHDIPYQRPVHRVGRHTREPGRKGGRRRQFFYYPGTPDFEEGDRQYDDGGTSQGDGETQFDGQDQNVGGGVIGGYEQHGSSFHTDAGDGTNIIFQFLEGDQGQDSGLQNTFTRTPDRSAQQVDDVLICGDCGGLTPVAFQSRRSQRQQMMQQMGITGPPRRCTCTPMPLDKGKRHVH